MTPTLSDDAMLLRAIVAAPEDDAPRLVFADWLEEHGRHERAEFVRVQIELWNRVRNKYCCAFLYSCYENSDVCDCPDETTDALRARERALWIDSVGLDDWGQPGTAYHSPEDGCGFLEQNGNLRIVRRGFVDEVRVPVAALCGPCERRQAKSMNDCRVAGCELCHGTGRTGIAAQLARLPLTKVRVSDRQPYEDQGEASWFPMKDANGEHPSSDVPDDLFDLLEDYRAFDPRVVRRYPTTTTAHTALSLAALALIRGLNQLAAANLRHLP